MTLKSTINLLRPSHYIKNLFVLAPLFFAFKFNDIYMLEMSLLAFLCFSFFASSIYILNDLRDVKEDRNHPSKRNRPIASGEISTKGAIILMLGLLSLGITIALLTNFNLFKILMIYLVLNIGYSLGLKHIPILDIFIVSVGFVLRIFAGAVTIDVPVTMWIILITFLLSLFLALAKRRDDIILAERGNKTRKNIDGYNLLFVNSGMIMMSAVVIVCYIFYTSSTDIQDKFGTHYLYITVIYVILGILRYMQITYVENNSGNPTKILIKDKFLQTTIFAWLITFWIIVN